MNKVIYQLDIVLEEPTILTDGSSESSGGHETLTAIPGTAVLGAMVGAIGIDPHHQRNLFARMFLSDATCFLNAYPLAEDARTLPRPRTFRQGKFDRQRVIDGIGPGGDRRPFEEIQAFFNDAMPPDRPKVAAGAFVLASTPGIDRSASAREQVHVAIDRQRRAAEQGMLFTYSSLPAGSSFRSIITTVDTNVADRLDTAARGPLHLRLGRSRGGGYGRCTGRLDRLASDWRECAGRSAVATVAIVTLLSDYMPIFELPVVEAFDADLRHAGGLSPTTILEPVDVAVRGVTGFRGVWGLPRAPRTAIDRGSVFMVRGEFDRDALRRSTDDGIGARRNEGFGRVGIDWEIHGRDSALGGERPAFAGASPVSRPHAADHVQIQSVVAAMTTRRHERQRRRFVEVALSHPRTRACVARLTGVPLAQIGNLRAAMSSGLDAAAIGRWYKSLSEKTAGDRWRKCRVPSLESSGFRRDGIGFVWTSLLGGTTKQGGCSDEPDGTADFTAAVRKVLLPLCSDRSLHEAAIADGDRTLRLFVIGLCGDVVRHRNLRDAAQEVSS